MYFGVDIGSATTDGVLIDKNGVILGSAITKSHSNHKNAVELVLETCCSLAQIERSRIEKVVATGYGRKSILFADKTITEISCHAMGMYFVNNEIDLLIDMGGQDSKIIRIGKDGRMENFVMNDKCAAGTGRFLENMANILGLSMDEMDLIKYNSKKQQQISSVCTVFAESEVISKIADGISVEYIVNGINNAIAEKILVMIYSMGISERIAISGGVAKNSGVVSALEHKLQTKIFIPDEPQIIGALGAASLARHLF